MRRALLLCGLAAVAPLARGEGDGVVLSGRMQAVVAAYRAGHYFDALWSATDILQEEPDNAAAKNYVWTITRKIQKERTSPPLTAREMDRALGLARRTLEERRRRTEEILGLLREADLRTRSGRSPQDLLEGMDGLDALFGKDLSEDMAGEQARAYRDAILSNLADSLQKGVFVSERDHLRAEGYLSYFQEDWPRALDLWRKASALDPSDVKLRRDVAALGAVLARREASEKVQDLARQARIHFKVGDNERAADTWREVLALDPANEEARRGLSAAKVAVEKTRKRAWLKKRTDEGLTLYRAGDAFAAAEVWLEVLQEDPTFEEARTWLQYAGKKIGRSRPAAEPARAPEEKEGKEPAAQAAPAAVPRPSRAMELYKEGVIQYAQDNPARAIELWKEALSMDPKLSRAQEALRQAQAELALQ